MRRRTKTKEEGEEEEKRRKKAWNASLSLSFLIAKARRQIESLGSQFRVALSREHAVTPQISSLQQHETLSLGSWRRASHQRSTLRGAMRVDVRGGGGDEGAVVDDDWTHVVVVASPASASATPNAKALKFDERSVSLALTAKNGALLRIAVVCGAAFVLR